MQNKKPKKKEYKGFSIFHRLLISYLIAGVIVSIIATAVFYLREQKFREEELKSQFSSSLGRSIAYFDRTYTSQIMEDLGFIEEAYIFNYFLSAQKEELLLAKTLAEQLFLHYTNRAGGIYLSARFINAQGKENIITIGKKRSREYVSLNSLPPDDTFYAHIYSLFKKLESATPGEILCGEPFEYEGRFTFLAGLSKSDPEVGGFAGAAIFHCDLADYFNHLYGRVLYKEHAASVLTLDDKVIFPPETNAASKKNTDSFYSVSDTVKISSNKQELFKIRFRISREVFISELRNILLSLIIYMFVIMIFITILAFIVSKRFSAPLKILADSAKIFATGDLSSRVNIKADGEIGMLVDSFNNMAENLRATTTSVDNLNREIAERKKAEDKIEEQKRFLEKVLGSLTYPFYVIDVKDYTIKMANFAAGFGDLSKGLTCYALTHRRDSPCTEGHICLLKEVMRTKKPARAEHIHYDKDGNARYVDVHGDPIFDSGGNVVQMIEYAIDITERKKAEERQNLLSKDLEDMNKLMVGRELRMIELKKEINKLNKELGKPAPFDEASLE